MRGRTLGLGVAAAAAVAAAVFVSLPRHHHTTARDDVAAYIAEVNAVQNRLAFPLARVRLAYARFSRAHRLGRGEASQLDAARRTLLGVRRRIAAVAAPAAARRLRTLLLRLLDDEASVTQDVAAIAEFLPGFEQVLRTVHAADLAFARQMATVHAPTPHAVRGTPAQIALAQGEFAAASARAAADQATIVDAYDARLERAVARLRRLAPPAAFAPAYEAQLRALVETARAGGRLASELRKPQRHDVAQLARAFTLASRESRTISAQRAEIVSIRAYNARVRTLGTAAAAVRRELLRLQRTVR